MKNSVFEKHTLALFKGNEIVFSSSKSGLRPIVTCVDECKDKYSECILYDKVVGLAAARIIVYSGIATEVVTKVISKQAKKLLERNNINLNVDSVVENILNAEKTSVCPMELKAQNMDNNQEFFLELRSIFLPS